MLGGILVWSCILRKFSPFSGNMIAQYISFVYFQVVNVFSAHINETSIQYLILFAGAKIDISTVSEPSNQPTNLLVTFLEYSSIVMQDIKGKSYTTLSEENTRPILFVPKMFVFNIFFSFFTDDARFNNAKLCLIILTCIVEVSY